MTGDSGSHRSAGACLSPSVHRTACLPREGRQGVWW